MKDIKDKKVYCIFCGTKNDIKNEKCSKCHKKLDQKNSLFWDYIKGKTWEEAEGQLKDYAFDGVKALIYKYLYGITLAVAVSFAGVAVVANAVSDKDNSSTASILKDKPLMICDNVDSLDTTLTCPNGYKLEDDKCVKHNVVAARAEKKCASGYTMSDNRCVSDASTAVIETTSCKLEDFPDNYSRTSIVGTGENVTWGKRNIFKVTENNSTCYVYWCSDPNLIISYSPGGEKYCDGSQGYGYEGGENVPKITKRSCPAGQTMLNGVCKVIGTVETKYSCEEGTLNGSKCEFDEETEPTGTCPDGYQYDEKCKKCVGE